MKRKCQENRTRRRGNKHTHHAHLHWLTLIEKILTTTTLGLRILGSLPERNDLLIDFTIIAALFFIACVQNSR